MRASVNEASRPGSRVGRPPVVLCLVGSLLLGTAGDASAESLLSIRESVLRRQRDRVLISVQARIGPIGQVHGIGNGDDCDVHVPLITQSLFLAVLGEVKNACSMGPSRAQLVGLGSGPMRVEGAFRIWFEGHDDSIPFREENRIVPGSYQNSGPAHLVEVHPITRLGNLDLRDRVRFIERNGQTIGWKTAESFRRAVRTQIRIRRQTIAGRRYIVVRCDCQKLANHYQLRVEIRYRAHPTDNNDGIVASGRILDAAGQNLLARARLFAVAGTPAAALLAGLEPGARVTLHGLARLSLRPLLSRVQSGDRTVDLPIELVVLHAVQ